MEDEMKNRKKKKKRWPVSCFLAKSKGWAALLEVNHLINYPINAT